MREKIESGSIKTQYLRDGDAISIKMIQNGVNVFGSIEQRVRQVR